jgi:hypothetical protein
MRRGDPLVQCFDTLSTWTAEEENIMRITIACGLPFGAIVLRPPAATAQFAEKRC